MSVFGGGDVDGWTYCDMEEGKDPELQAWIHPEMKYHTANPSPNEIYGLRRSRQHNEALGRLDWKMLEDMGVFDSREACCVEVGSISAGMIYTCRYPGADR